MGNAVEKEEVEQGQNEDFLSKYSILKKFNDQRIGECTLLADKMTKQECLLRELNSTDEDEYKKGLKKYESLLKLDHPNIVKLVGFHYKSESQFCSTFYKTFLMYEYVPNSIEKEIIVRKQQQQPFSEQELWSLLTGAVLGFSFLQKNNIIHQSVKPSQIFVSKDGLVKVSDPGAFNQVNSYASVLTNNSPSATKSIYLSPALITALRQGEWQAQHNPYKSDIFSLGMTILHASLLESLDDCYKYEESLFFSEVLENKLNILQGKCSSDFCNTINLMLRYQEDERPDFNQFQDYLLNMKSLQPSSPENEQHNHHMENPHEPAFFQQNERDQSIQQSFKEETPMTSQAQFKVLGDISNQSEYYQQQQQQYLLQQQMGQKPPQQQQQLQVTNSTPFNVSISQGLSKDDLDNGSKLSFIPKEQPVPLNKPDENLVNELERPSVRDENFQSQYDEQYNQYFLNQQQQQQQQQEQSEQQQYIQQYYQQQQNQAQYLQQQQIAQQQQYMQYQQVPQQIEQDGLNNPNLQNTYQAFQLPPQYQAQDTFQTQHTYQIPMKASNQQDFQVQPYFQATGQQAEGLKQYTQPDQLQQHQKKYSGLSTSPNKVFGTSSQQQQQEVLQPYSQENSNKFQQSGQRDTPAIQVTTNTIPEPSVLMVKEVYQKQHQTEVEPATDFKYTSPDIEQILKKYEYTNNNINNVPAVNQQQQKKTEYLTNDYKIYQQFAQTTVPSYKATTPQQFKTNPDQVFHNGTATTTGFAGTNYPSSLQVNTITEPKDFKINFQNQNAYTQYDMRTYVQKAEQEYQKDYKLEDYKPQTDLSKYQIGVENTQTLMPSYVQPVSNQVQTDLMVNKYSNIMPKTLHEINNFKGQTQFGGQQTLEQVIENYQNGSRYEGEKLNGMRHGKGKFYYQDGGLYDGMWRENKMHGKGILYYSSGKPAYDGDWIEDKFEGFGILYNENPAQLDGQFDYRDFDLVEEYWTKYDGEFKDDNKEGYGTLNLSNGEKFTGTFKKDFVSGPGTFFKLDNTSDSGYWINNKLQGQF